MANVIKHKRGSGSDPAANNLVIGELAIRTDNGKLFTKMDSGAIAEIAGGGSDIAINTLSSSSATGGGSATFNGSAYRFTLSSPPSVSAAQLLVSVNGVIQKPVAGTGQPSEGFSVSGNDIIFGDAPATGADFFILTFRSLGVSEPADNSVTSAKIVDGAIVNADINASAAIAGTKISPDFGSQNIATTGALDIGANAAIFGTLTISNATPTLIFTENDANPDYKQLAAGGEFVIQNNQGGSYATRFKINADGHVDVTGNLDVGAGLDVTGGGLTVNTGTVNTCATFTSTDAGAVINITDNSARSSIEQHGTDLKIISDTDAGDANSTIKFLVDNSTKMLINSSGNVGIGTTSPGANLHVHTDANGEGILVKSTGNTSNALTFDANRGTGGVIGVAYGRWNGTTVAQMSFISGSDGTNKDDGVITFGTESAASSGNVNATERMRIASDGKVGINIAGTDNTSPVRNLDIADSSGAILRLISSDDSLGANERVGEIEFYTDDDDGGHIGSFIKAIADPSDSFGRRTALLFGTQSAESQNAVERMRIDASGTVFLSGSRSGNSISNATLRFNIVNSNGDEKKAQIISTKVGDVSSTIEFGTTASHSYAERMRIHSDGSVLIATTSTTVNSANFGIVLGNDGSGGMFKNIGGSGDVFRAGGTQGLLQINGDGDAFNTNNSYGQLSDETLKQDIVDAASQWNDIKNLKVRKFRFKDNPTGVLQIGVIAQEIEKVSAGLVQEDDEGIKSVKYSVLYMKAVKCLQEAIAKIEVLETKVAALEAK